MIFLLTGLIGKSILTLPRLQPFLARLNPAQLRWLVFALGTATGLFVALWGWRHQGFVTQADDPYGFAGIGRDLANGRGFLWREHLTMRRAPLYPALIAVLNLIAPDNPVRLLQFVQSLLLGGICLLAFDIGERLFTRRTGLIAGVLCAFHPMLLRYVPDVQVEIVLTFLFLLTVWIGLRFREQPTMGTGAMFGIAAACAALTKPTPLLYPSAFLIYLWWERRQTRGDRKPFPIAPVLAVFMAMAAVILPWTARNYRVSGGQFVLISTNAGGEFLRSFIYSKPQYALLRQRAYVEGENEANEMEINLFRRQGLEWERDEAETEQVLNAAAKAKLREDWASTVRKTIVSVFTFWYQLNSRNNSLVVGLLAVGAWALAFVGIRRARHESRPYGLALLPILYLNLLYAILLALGRYSSAATPLLLVLAAYGLESLLPARTAFAPSHASPASATVTPDAITT